jgi:hypothetical protein
VSDTIRDDVIQAWRERGFTKREILRFWRRRERIFEGIERDTVDRRQVMPFPEPPVERQVGP